MADQHFSVLPSGDGTWPFASPFVFRLESGTEYTVAAPAVVRFQRHTSPLPGGCWQLKGQTSGYAHFKLAGYWVRAHRFAYAAFLGPVPDGLHLDHICANRSCVRPAHMEPVTRQENARRRAMLAWLVKDAERRAAAKAVAA